MEILVAPLGSFMKICYDWVGEYSFAIILFTIFTKLVLLPITIWVHKNSIKLIKMQPEINKVKAFYYGNSERIAEEQAKIFKKNKYNAFASLIPLAIQIILLMSVIEVIYNPLTYILNVPKEIIEQLVIKTGELTGTDIVVNSIQVAVVNAIKNPDLINQFISLGIENIHTIITDVVDLNTKLFVFDLSTTPIIVQGVHLLVPIIAGFSAWLLCIAQNKSNVLQSEQSKLNKYSTMTLSVGLSVYLGLFVPAGVAFYWIIGNLYAILQMYCLNAIISPKKYIDYEALEKSREELNTLNKLGQQKKKLFEKDENAKRERVDYKKFFSVVNKKLVFYSEKNGFYKYFDGIIEELLRTSNITIHYITSDPDDNIFNLAKAETRIKPYYIGERKLITLMMKMDADMVVMTMPDFDNYHIKKSIVKKDVHYVYMPHGVASTNMTTNIGAYDNFNSIFCVGQHQIDEIRESEAMYNLPAKKLIPCGYGMVDKLIAAHENSEIVANTKKNILVAPSWQEDNILDSCIDSLINSLLQGNYSIIIRPHPEYIKRYPAKMDLLIDKYKDKFNEDFIIESDFSSNKTIFMADLLITDWSGISFEYSYCTKRPVLFVNTKKKILNEDYLKYKNIPTDITIRDEIGISIEKVETIHTNDYVNKLLENGDEYQNKIEKIMERYLFNIGKSGEVGAKYILKTLSKK